MGSKQKVRQLLETSEAHEHYSKVVEHALTFFIAKAEKTGGPFVDELKKLRAEYKDEFAQAFEVTEEVYCEIFTDEEMDELILIHSNAALQKLRGLTSEIFNKALGKFALRSE
jgi:hypothetical protein